MLAAGYTVSEPDAAPAFAASRAQRASDASAGQQAAIAVASADHDCQASKLLPVKQRLEETQIAGLAKKFPQYQARADSLEHQS